MVTCHSREQVKQDKIETCKIYFTVQQGLILEYRHACSVDTYCFDLLFIYMMLIYMLRQIKVKEDAGEDFLSDLEVTKETKMKY